MVKFMGPTSNVFLVGQSSVESQKQGNNFTQASQMSELYDEIS